MAPHLRSAMSNHKVLIETNRHKGINVALRVCKNCFTFTYIDDEYHFLMICENLKDEYHTYQPNEPKFMYTANDNKQSGMDWEGKLSS